MLNTYIVEILGKQYLTKDGMILTVSYMNQEVGSEIKVKLIGEITENNVNTAAQELNAKILEHKKGKKIYSFKKNRRKRYSRKVGYRDLLTVIQIIGK